MLGSWNWGKIKSEIGLSNSVFAISFDFGGMDFIYLFIYLFMFLLIIRLLCCFLIGWLYFYPWIKFPVASATNINHEYLGSVNHWDCLLLNICYQTVSSSKQCISLYKHMSLHLNSFPNMLTSVLVIWLLKLNRYVSIQGGPEKNEQDTSHNMWMQ